MEEQTNNANHLAVVHNGKQVAKEVKEVKKEVVQNHLAEVHKYNGVPVDERLGNVPDVLPTHFGGIELETVPLKKIKKKTKNK
jgi:hypothetical protein